MTLLKKTNSFFPELPSLFSGFFDDDRSLNTDGGWMPRWASKVPAVNITEDKGEFDIQVAAPGLDKKDFQIDIDNGNLIISCEREEENNVDEESYSRREFSYNSFSRSFKLPDSVNTNQIKANYKDGVLKLVLPKKEEVIKATKKEISIS